MLARGSVTPGIEGIRGGNERPSPTVAKEAKVVKVLNMIGERRQATGDRRRGARSPRAKDGVLRMFEQI